MENYVISGTRIESLDRENYSTWKMQIVALLIKNNYWDYVNGTITPPMLSPNADSAARTAHETVIAEWKKVDRKAKSDLILSIHKSELPPVRNLETSRGVWQKLDSFHA